MPTELTKLPVPIVDGAATPLRVGVYGEGGTGKTTFALSFPNPLVIDTDGGVEGDAVKDAKGELWTPDKWQDLNAIYTWLKVNLDKREYGTIVLDSIDTLCHFIRQESMDLPIGQYRKANTTDTQLIIADQQDYNRTEVAMRIFLTKLRNISQERGVNVVITSAVREVDVEKHRLKRTFDVQPAVEKILLYWCNLYGELVVREVPKSEGSKDKVEQRVLWTSVADTTRKNKTRFGVLRPGVINPTFDRIVGLIEKGTK